MLWCPRMPTAIPRTSRTLVACAALAACVAGEAPALRALRTPGNGVAIHRGDAPEPMLVQHARADFRPYIHPIVAPDGRGVLTEDSPGHHRWQHGLYVGMNAVNGLDFWKTDTVFHPRPLAEPEVSGNGARWTVVSQWSDPKGAPVLVESQAWTMTDLGDRYRLDLAWTLTADVDIAFGKHQYGGLFLRMPFRKDAKAQAITGDGPPKDQMRARWVAVQMDIAGRDDGATIAIMDHPTNPDHPAPWRIDGQLGIAPSRCILGAWKLAKGASATARYRVLVACGRSAAAAIEQEFTAFAGVQP